MMNYVNDFSFYTITLEKNNYLLSSLTHVHSGLIGAFNSLSIRPPTTKRGSPGRSRVLAASPIPSRMKQSTSTEQSLAEGNLLLFHSAAEETYSSGREPWGS